MHVTHTSPHTTLPSRRNESEPAPPQVVAAERWGEHEHLIDTESHQRIMQSGINADRELLGDSDYFPHGAAFLVPYALAVLLLGIPILAGLKSPLTPAHVRG